MRASSRSAARSARVEQRAAALATSLFFHEVLGNFHYVATALDEMATTLDETESPSLRVMGAVARLGHHALRGEFPDLRGHVQRARRRCTIGSQHASHVGLTGADFGVLELAWSSHSLWALGRAEEAEARVQQALTLARDADASLQRSARARVLGDARSDGRQPTTARRCGRPKRAPWPSATVSSTTRRGPTSCWPGMRRDAIHPRRRCRRFARRLMRSSRLAPGPAFRIISDSSQTRT